MYSASGDFFVKPKSVDNALFIDKKCIIHSDVRFSGQQQTFSTKHFVTKCNLFFIYRKKNVE